jgi:hypothetical protein
LQRTSVDRATPYRESSNQRHKQLQHAAIVLDLRHQRDRAAQRADQDRRIDRRDVIAHQDPRSR